MALNSVTGAEAEAFSTIIAHSQAQRIDKQRFPLPMLPGIGVNSGEKENGSDTKVGLLQYLNYWCSGNKDY